MNNTHSAARKDIGGTREHGDAVKAINALLEQQDSSNLKIGEIVDRVIGPAGRADYGGQVIASLAANPDLMCSDEHLRRCWHYFRLMRDHGGVLRDQFPALRFGHYYQIARLLQLETEFTPENVTNAIRAMAQKAMAEGKGGKPMPADAVARAVTTHIKSLKGRGPAGYPSEEKAADNTEKEDADKALETAHMVLSENIGAIQAAAVKIADCGRYDHACRLQTDVAHLAEAHIAILGHIVHHDPQSIVIAAARKSIIVLGELVGLKVVADEGTKKTEVLS